MTEEALELLLTTGLDGVNVDWKGDPWTVRQFCGGELEVVVRNYRVLERRGVHVEITTLVIPGANDGEGTLRFWAERIVEELASTIPWHVTRYFPAHQFRAPPTPIPLLEQAKAGGEAAGLRFVYIGNVPGHPDQHTHCLSCKSLLLEREGMRLVPSYIQANICSRCQDGAANPFVIPKIKLPSVRRKGALIFCPGSKEDDPDQSGQSQDYPG